MFTTKRMIATLFGMSLLGFTCLTPAASGSSSDTNKDVARRNLTSAEIQQVLGVYGVHSDATSRIGCAVLNPDAERVTEVPSFNFGDQAYWLKYAARGVCATKVTLIVVPLFTNSPLRAQSQTFSLPAPDDSDISTPFGIPLWALDLTTGPWLLIVQNDLDDKAICRFTVVK